MGPRTLAVSVMREGMLAAEADQPATACPYGKDRPYSRRGWIIGWTGARRRMGRPLPSDRIAEERNDLD